MKRKQYNKEIELFEVPASTANVAIKRTKGILRVWLAEGNLGLNNLIASVYLQGVTDGYDAKEREIELQCQDSLKE
jgi:hypothetical protein